MNLLNIFCILSLWSLSLTSFGWAVEQEQPTRLRVTNRCGFPIWMQHSDNVPETQNIKLNTNQSHDYKIPDEGLAATRFWPKIGCDASGNNCVLGQSMPPCPDGGCQPPIESKFEATWVPISCPVDNPPAECLTFYNASQVDGYTLPFTITAKGPDVGKGNCVSSDASRLDLAKCPSNETLGTYKNVDLRVFDPRDPTKIIGCMAPCKRLNYSAPWGLGVDESKEPAAHMCCPTDPDKIANNTCTWENGCATATSCKSPADPESIVHTQYVKNLHEMAPGVYSYSYDDVNGLHQCTGRTKFEVIFCPLPADKSHAIFPTRHDKPAAPVTHPDTPKPVKQQSSSALPEGVHLCSDGKTFCDASLGNCQCCPDGKLCPGAKGCPLHNCPVPGYSVKA